eukprot:TRINITY_DN1069_c0_g6_i1.p1 TRINITY_DN1069_c0_g6~~TRINITY_DN1069_c0_g6_i1.p1  ORF type:complete len:194 (+),score=63.80 TRINITY_DN1069_c0_g6_i1:63-644(+)
MPQLPPVLWAERPDVVLVTFQVQDASDVDIKLLEKSIDFKCKSDGKEYATTLELKGELIPEESTQAVKPRQIEMKLKKKDEEGGYWDGLTSKKQSHVKVDWTRWVDEDEANGAGDLGDFGAGGMPGMGGMGGMGGMESLMGGMGGMNLGGGGDPEQIQQMLANMGGEGMGADAGPAEGDDEDDEDMPTLEAKQ